MKELTFEQVGEINGGISDVAACNLAVGGLATVGGLNATVAGYAGALAFGGPVGWAIGLGTATVYGGMALFAHLTCEK